MVRASMLGTIPGMLVIQSLLAFLSSSFPGINGSHPFSNLELGLLLTSCLQVLISSFSLSYLTSPPTHWSVTPLVGETPLKFPCSPLGWIAGCAVLCSEVQLQWFAQFWRQSVVPVKHSENAVDPIGRSSLVPALACPCSVAIEGDIEKKDKEMVLGKMQKWLLGLALVSLVLLNIECCTVEAAETPNTKPHFITSGEGIKVLPEPNRKYTRGRQKFFGCREDYPDLNSAKNMP
ncbi:hypothetical protein MRB53_026161 [Persea americana]|uniref:Uncharacterized protein n=1 Tax=Persea americana TaxID=3435 RepID=A0ACC2LHS8_PERAE|nr:hypothetical protein MRB53_026161 [Persea americana]